MPMSIYMQKKNSGLYGKIKNSGLFLQLFDIISKGKEVRQQVSELPTGTLLFM